MICIYIYHICSYIFQIVALRTILFKVTFCTASQEHSGIRKTDVVLFWHSRVLLYIFYAHEVRTNILHVLAQQKHRQLLHLGRWRTWCLSAVRIYIHVCGGFNGFNHV